MLRFFSRYMVIVGLVANLALLSLLVYWFVAMVGGTESYRGVHRSMFGSLDGVAVAQVPSVAPGTINPALKALPANVWHKIHQQSGDGPGDFKRQSHGGAAFDPVRGRVILFGSSTHGLDWDNSVRYFDMGSLSWSQSYPADDFATYRVNRDGIPVAGIDADRPWAMHTFDAVEFDPIADRLIISSHPEHMSPRKKWGVDKALWRQIKSHPTWFYQVDEGRWWPKPGKAVSFFPYATTFDLKRRAVIGVRSGNYWELAADSTEWVQIGKGGPHGWHVSTAYDSDRDIVVAYGTNKKTDAVWQYRRGERMGTEMPTPGKRPPGDQSVPLAYHPEAKRVVALVQRRSPSGDTTTETWLYSTREDAWGRVESAGLPFGVRMNYHMVYDPNHALLVLVTNKRHDYPSVWVLRLSEPQEARD